MEMDGKMGNYMNNFAKIELARQFCKAIFYISNHPYWLTEHNSWLAFDPCRKFSYSIHFFCIGHTHRS